MAAAYAALVSLFNNLELIQTHPRHSFSFDNKQIQSLLQIVCFLIDFMEARDYHGGGKEAAEAMERQIASAAHAAEDVVESHVVDQIDAGSTLDGEKRSVFLPDVQKMIEDMELVRRKAIKIQEVQSVKVEQPKFSAATSSTPLTSSDKDKMVGFDDVLRQLLDLLTGNPSSRQVIPIVGTGGIGKTTLAKNAFQHALIVEHFHICLWVTISQQYDVSEILSKLLSSLGKPTTETVGELGRELHQSLYGRRYLIVLDDMWSEKPWDMIKRFFPDTSCGSRIIVTSRQPVSLGSLSLAMSFLDNDESWDLFCQKVFAEQKCPLELEEIGKKIVGKCRGLPLAIVVVGGHLRMSPKTQEYWENVANHMKSILKSGDNQQLFDILYLSYGYLPVHLKPCFLYMGVFPEDKEISVSDLIWLWIGEGFLKPNKDQTLEEVAEGCLNDLIARNLILVDQRSWKRKAKTCRIHDVLRDLGLMIAEKEKFFCVYNNARSIDSERRIIAIEPWKMTDIQRPSPLVRSKIEWRLSPITFDSKLLRVMMTDREEHDIFRKFNLRFVCGYFEIDSSIYLLWNLQTLIIAMDDCDPLAATAPSVIWQMTELRHLVCGNIFLQDPFPNNQANGMILGKLQTLKNVVNLSLSDEVCKRIPNIKELVMTFDYSVKELPYCPHNLGRLYNLESLGCSIYHEGPKWHEFAQALTFPSSLKELVLTGVQLDWDEITMKVGSLPLLEALQLRRVKGGAEWNSIEGGFPRLRCLDIGWCDLRSWNAEGSHFPVLEHLDLTGLSELDELACGIGEIPTLESIEMLYCSVCLGISAMRVLVEQEDYGNDNLRLHVKFVNNEEGERFNKIVQEEGLTTNNLHLSYITLDMLQLSNN